MTVETTNRADTDAWDQHWTAYAATNALNPAQVYRRKLIFENLGLHTSKIPVRLLDLGSGTGEFASEVLLARRDAEVVGLDLSSSGVELAKKKVPGANFLDMAIEKRALELVRLTNKFNAVIGVNTLPSDRQRYDLELGDASLL